MNTTPIKRDLIIRALKRTMPALRYVDVYPVRNTLDTIWQLECDGYEPVARDSRDEWPAWMNVKPTTEQSFEYDDMGMMDYPSKTYIRFCPDLHVVFLPHIVKTWARTTDMGDDVLCIAGLARDGRVMISQRTVKYGLEGVYVDFWHRLNGTHNPAYAPPRPQPRAREYAIAAHARRDARRFERRRQRLARNYEVEVW